MLPQTPLPPLLGEMDTVLSILNAQSLSTVDCLQAVPISQPIRPCLHLLRLSAVTSWGGLMSSTGCTNPETSLRAHMGLLRGSAPDQHLPRVATRRQPLRSLGRDLKLGLPDSHPRLPQDAAPLSLRSWFPTLDTYPVLLRIASKAAMQGPLPRPGAWTCHRGGTPCLADDGSVSGQMRRNWASELRDRCPSLPTWVLPPLL